MKRTINHVTYNTETSEIVSERKYEIAQFSETLYRNNKGAYFLVGTGFGPYTHTVRLSENNYHGRPHTGTIARPGQKLIPMTDEEAMSWQKNEDKISPKRLQVIEAIKSNDVQLLQQYISTAIERLNENEKIEGQMPALAYAVIESNIEIVKYLLKAGASRDEKFYYNDNVSVAAAIAIEKGEDEILDILLDTGEYTYYGDSSMISAAIKTGNIHVMERISKLETSADADKIPGFFEIDSPNVIEALSYCRSLKFSPNQLRCVYSAGLYAAARRISQGTTPMYWEEIEEVLLKDAMQSGIAEVKRVISNVYSPITTQMGMISSVLKNWMFEGNCDIDNEELIWCLINSREKEPERNESGSSLGYRSDSMKIIKASIRYCNKDFVRKVILFYHQSLSREDIKMIHNMIDHYRADDKLYLYEVFGAE